MIVIKIDKLKTKLGLLLCMIPAVLGFLYVFLFGVNVCLWDQFDGTVPLFSKLSSGTLTFSHLWARHNEHIIFFPSIIMLVLGILTRYNTLAEMCFIEILLFISFFVFLFVAKRQHNFKVLPLLMV